MSWFQSRLRLHFAWSPERPCGHGATCEPRWVRQSPSESHNAPKHRQSQLSKQDRAGCTMREDVRCKSVSSHFAGTTIVVSCCHGSGSTRTGVAASELIGIAAPTASSTCRPPRSSPLRIVRGPYPHPGETPTRMQSFQVTLLIRAPALTSRLTTRTTSLTRTSPSACARMMVETV